MSIQFLVVSKDILGARMTRPVAEALSKMGHTVRCVLEAKAIDSFEDSSLETLLTKVSPREILQKFSIDAVLVSYGSPINLESTFAHAANQQGIPVIGFEDYWCGHRRTDAVTDCVLTIDNIGANLAREQPSVSGVYIVGNPAIDTTLEISDEVRDVVTELKSRFGHVFIYVDSGAGSAHEHIDLLIQCLNCSSVNYCVVPRYHPKWANVHDPLNPPETYHQVWDRMFAVLGDRVKTIECDRTDPLSALADVTFSGLSSLMTTAVYHGRQAVSLLTPMTRSQLQAETGGTFSHSPLVLADVAHEITAPVPLEEIFNNPKVTGDTIVQAYDAQAAVEAVLDYMR